VVGSRNAEVRSQIWGKLPRYCTLVEGGESLTTMDVDLRLGVEEKGCVDRYNIFWEFLENELKLLQLEEVSESEFLMQSLGINVR
jgi:hypothetical protein